jgi:hypothetical protein
VTCTDGQLMVAAATLTLKLWHVFGARSATCTSGVADSAD